MLTTTTNRILYQGDGSTVDFAIPFDYLSGGSDLVVVLRDSNDTEIVQTYTSQYSVTPLNNSSPVNGTLTMVTAPDASSTLLIYRERSKAQSLDLQTSGVFPSASVELSFDKVAMWAQEFRSGLDRAASLKRTDSSLTMELPLVGDRTSSLLGFDASGRFAAYAPSTYATASAPISPFWTSTIQVTNASNSLIALGHSAFSVDLADETNASNSLVKLGVSPYMVTVLDETSAVNARSVLGTYEHNRAMVVNGFVDATVSSGSLIFRLKTRAGSTPSSTDPVIVSFGNDSQFNADYSVVTVTSSCTVTVDISSSLGHSAASADEAIFAFLINNSGAAELAVCGGGNTVTSMDRVTTSAMGTNGSADTRYQLYSTTARSGVACRYMGKFFAPQGTVSFWNSNINEVASNPLNRERSIRQEIVCSRFKAFGSGSTHVIQFSTTDVSLGTDMSLQMDSTVGTVVTINREGLYHALAVHKDASISMIGISLNQATLTDNVFTLPESQRLAAVETPASAFAEASVIARLVPGDKIRPCAKLLSSSGVEAKFRIIKIGE